MSTYVPGTILGIGETVNESILSKFYPLLSLNAWPKAAPVQNSRKGGKVIKSSH